MTKYTLEYTELTTLKDIIIALDKGGIGLVAMVDQSQKLVGIVTDGDLRRAILNREENLAKVINDSPIKMHYDAPKDTVVRKLKAIHRRHMPLVDSHGRLQSVFVLDGFELPQKSNSVVIMAGGLGSRLGELTKTIPKPMLKVGNKPMLEHLVEQFREQGFKKFTFCLNHLKEKIMDHFGDGSDFDVEISYVVEEKKLGTAGALSLLRGKFDLPFFVINADVLTTLDFERLMQYHCAARSIATMCVREYQHTLPYGVISSDKSSRLVGITEKPTQSFDVNSGIYVLEPQVIDFIPEEQMYDMPELFGNMLSSGEHCSVYKLDDYWLDIGQVNDFEKANRDINYDS
ncbi:NTP transferase domain-containing protein [Vibrio sp. S9_S30]|uniref:nucleotidyltransferase family protein n=1 Tax=Vibrio sp. S9_S30 TaxID=2720226 RepID=UPI00168026F3|nr:nucleotidyltransferase family protein [Vibrio sp. S9_S30]MBD1558473.1 NTP transferase domain-containing protein [Vibrio sp. S9_S30]